MLVQSILDSEETIQTLKMDVFSYGILLCEVLTCHFPEHKLFHDMKEQVRTNNGEPLYSLIVSCTKRDPDTRPTIKEIIEQLDSHYF